MHQTNQRIPVLVTIDQNYIPQLNVMLWSLLRSTPEACFDVYLLHASLTEEAVASTRTILGSRGSLYLIWVDDSTLEKAPTSSRYPREIYFRIFAAQYLPEALDRILYLDPDLIVNRSILPLYEMDMGDCYFAAASHIGPVLQKFNEVRLSMDTEAPYINSGVMLMNLALLRREQDAQAVFSFIEKYGHTLFLPDQDIISSLYGSRILALDTFRYNMTEKLFSRHSRFEDTLTLDWVRQNSVIIHYCGRNKPWKPNYRGKLNVFYQEVVAQMEQDWVLL